MEQLLKRIEQYNELQKNISDEVKSFVQNKNNSLDIRWELFKSSKLGQHDGIYHNPDGIDWNKMSLYDDFYMDKYATITADDFIELCEYKIQEEDAEINIDQVKEYFLENFLWSFENDW